MDRVTRLRELFEGHDGQQAFLRLFVGADKLAKEMTALKKAQAEQSLDMTDPVVRPALMELHRVAARMESANTELRSSLTNSKRFFGHGSGAGTE